MDVNDFQRPDFNWSMLVKGVSWIKKLHRLLTLYKTGFVLHIHLSTLWLLLLNSVLWGNLCIENYNLCSTEAIEVLAIYASKETKAGYIWYINGNLKENTTPASDIKLCTTNMFCAVITNDTSLCGIIDRKRIQSLSLGAENVTFGDRRMINYFEVQHSLRNRINGNTGIWSG